MPTRPRRFPLVLAVLIASTAAVHACKDVEAHAAGLPAAALDASGRIDLDAIRASGYEGQVDLRGQNLTLDGSTLAPVLSAKSSAEGGWRAGFHAPGFDDAVRAMAVFGGNLYVGGSFGYVNGVSAHLLARWDGISWTGISITGNAVNALAVIDGSLIVGGNFLFTDHADAVCQNVARYDGAVWSAIGQTYNGITGFDGTVYAMGINSQGRLVVGGGFWAAGLTTLHGVTFLYNGYWYPMSQGVNGTVYAIANFGGLLVIGGTFTGDNLGNGLGHIARWAGSGWQGLAAPATSSNGDVRSLQVHEGNLYAGGAFTTIEGSTIDGLACWDGSAWSAVPGFPGGINVLCLRSTPSLLVASGTYRSGGAVWDNIDDGVATAIYDVIQYGDDCVVGGAFKVLGGGFSPRLALLDSGQLIAWPGFTGAGLDGGVQSLAVHAGEVVASGDFTMAGTVAANRLAGWNGSEWHEIGGGLPSAGRAMLSYGGDLVVAGDFTSIGAVTVNRIARWDGAQWQALGTGLSARPAVLIQYGPDLIAAGGISSAGGEPVANIARWDGTEWHALGSGLNGAVRALVNHDGLLIAGGDFTAAGGSPAAYLAAWNGSSWSAYGGADGPVYALAELNGDLAVGGLFMHVGGVDASRVARLRNGEWESLGSGFADQWCNPGCQAVWVEKLMAVGSELYAQGSVKQAGHVMIAGFARWSDWNHWLGMPWPANSENITSMTTLGGALFVGGDISTEGTNLAVWDAAAGAPVDNDPWWAGFDGRSPWGPVYDLGTYGDDLVVAGLFDQIGTLTAGSIASWDGETWNNLGGGLMGSEYQRQIIKATLEYQGSLYAAGGFRVPPSSDQCNLVRWNGATWEGLGFPNETIPADALVIYGDRLIMGGRFTTLGGLAANNIVAWDGTSFSPLGDGLNEGVWALAVYQGKLVAGGRFTQAGGLPAAYLAIWNGTSWESPPGFTTNRDVNALYSDGSDLYVGGNFTVAGGSNMTRIARWDGSAFHPLGAGLNSFVYHISSVGDRLLVGGEFNGRVTPSPNFLGLWDGVSWSDLAGGMDHNVYTSRMWRGDLYVGGEFTTAGGKNSSYIARWVMSPTGMAVEQPPAVPVRIEAMYPNPFNPSTTVRFSLARSGNAKLTVHDLRGRTIRTLANEQFTAGEHSALWDGRDTSGRLVGSGVYFVRVQAAGEAAVRKITLVK